jgi:hypothetical protein
LLRRLKDEFCQGSEKSSALLEELKVMESYIDKEDYYNVGFTPTSAISAYHH